MEARVNSKLLWQWWKVVSALIGTKREVICLNLCYCLSETGENAE